MVNTRPSLGPLEGRITRRFRWPRSRRVNDLRLLLNYLSSHMRNKILGYVLFFVALLPSAAHGLTQFAVRAGIVIHDGNQAGPAQFRSYTFHASPSPRPWPSYSAEDYRTLHNVKLSGTEITLIRKTLSLTKPCQRPFLRFAFPSDGGAEFPFVLFFQGAAPFEAIHALWTNNMWYDPHDGRIFAMSGSNPKWNGIRFEVDHTGCDGQYHW